MELKEITKEAVIISDTATFRDALDVMLRDNTNTLLVVDETGSLVGEVSVSNFFDAVVPTTFDGDAAINMFSNESEFEAAVAEAADTPITEFMSIDFSTVHPNDSFLHVAATAIAEGRIRIAVVDHDNHPIGIISRQGLKKILKQFSKSH